MLLRLPSGLKIAIPPFLFWQRHTAHVLKIDSGGAFHPGHVTTRLCLELLEEDLHNVQCRSLLDVGCGSGILALFSVRKGVPRALGIDINPRAVKISRTNGHTNQLSHGVWWIVGTVAAVQGQFDCITANLPVGVLLEIIEDLAAVCSADGSLILSGFQDVHWHVVYEKLLDQRLQVQKVVSGDRSFYGIPPSGSFTWMAARVTRSGRGGNAKSR